MADEKKHDKILNAAIECFGRWGFKKTSVDQIAEAAGVAKGTVYLYAKNKDDLLKQALNRELEFWSGELSAAIQPQKDAGEILMRIALLTLEAAEKRPMLRELLLRETQAPGKLIAAITARLGETGQKHVEDVLRLGIAQGRFAANLDLKNTAAVLIDLYLSALVLGHRRTQAKSAVRQRQLATMKLVMKGLERRPP